jgi:cation-transporting P-type ATPase 13A2
MFMGQTEPYRHLTPHLPSGALISVPVLASVIGSIAIQLAFQVFMFYYVSWWSFYEPPPHIDPQDADDNTECFENTSMFLISLYQYVVVCVAFSISKPFR